MPAEIHSSPFFSVVIPTYNRSALLKRALNSLISQTEPDWEALIIDDESDDDTYTQVLPYLESHSKIKYIHQTHKGCPGSKNTGIFSARGRFITFLDSDDEFHPEHLQSRKHILHNNPAIKFLYGGARVIGNQMVPDRNDLSKQIALSECVIGGTFVLEREIAIFLNGFKDIAISEDAELFERIKNLGLAIMKITDPTYIYHREIQNSITHQFSSN